MLDFSVLFCRTTPNNSEVPEDSIVVWPYDRNWNDHGYGFHGKALIRRAGREPLQCRLFLVPQANEFSRLDSWIEAQWLDNLTGANVMHLEGRFLSILRSEQDYRAVVRYFEGDSNQIGRVLRPMRDIVYLKWTGTDGAAVKELLESARSIKGVFRHHSSYLAWSRGQWILSGGHTPLIADARVAFSFTALLPGFTGPHSLRVGFGAPQPLVDRCHALIGRNGAGKSQLLRELIHQFGIRADPGSRPVFIDGGAPAAKDVELLPASYAANRVVAMSWDAKSLFPMNSRLDSPFQYFSFGMNSNLSQDLVDDPLHVNASETQASILLQLLRDDEEVGGKRPYERLLVMLRGVLALGRVCVYAKPTETEPAGRWVAVDGLRVAGDAQQLELYSRIDRSSDPQRLDDENVRVPLSSGERMFLNFGIRCAARVLPGTLLIMDEPETHLHPNLISSFMRMLASLLADTQSVALIATHSPFVVRELPGRCVHIVEIDSDRRPAINTAFLRTLGASVDQLSVDIFGDGESEQLNRDLAEKLAGLGLTFDEIRQQYGRDISSDMLSEIYELMTNASEGTRAHE